MEDGTSAVLVGITLTNLGAQDSPTDTGRETDLEGVHTSSFGPHFDESQNLTEDGDTRDGLDEQIGHTHCIGSLGGLGSETNEDTIVQHLVNEFLIVGNSRTADVTEGQIEIDTVDLHGNEWHTGLSNDSHIGDGRNCAQNLGKLLCKVLQRETLWGNQYNIDIGARRVSVVTVRTGGEDTAADIIRSRKVELVDVCFVDPGFADGAEEDDGLATAVGFLFGFDGVLAP